MRSTAAVPLSAARVAVPADFSSAAFFIVAACLAAERPLLLTNVGVNPTRTGLLELLRRMGADIRVHEHGVAGPDAEPVADIEVRRSLLRGITVPESLVPLSIDEFPVFFVAAACAQGETLVRGALELRVKESDRLAAMAAGLDDARRRAPAAHRRAVDPRRGRASPAAPSTAAATIASPWPSRSRPCARARRCRSWTWPTSPPPFQASPRSRARPAWGWPRPDGHCSHGRLSHRHHRRPERLGQGHHQPRGGTPGRVASARQRGAVPPGGARRRPGAGRTRDDPGRHAALAAAHGGVLRHPFRRRRGGAARRAAT